MNPKLQLFRIVGICFVLACSANQAFCDVISGYQVEHFVDITDPLRMTYDQNGDIYVGRSNNGSGGMRPDPVRIYKVGLDGTVQEFGNDPIPGPAAVLYDADGAIGPAGSVLVGGFVTSNSTLNAILPNESVQSLFGPTSVFPGPSDMAFDSNGRLVYITETGSLYATSGGSPSKLADLPDNGRFLAIDASDRIFTATADGTIRIYDSTGNLIDGSFTTGLSLSISLAFGSGGDWGTDLYALSEGTLYRIDSLGNAAVIGTNLTEGASSYLLFHPDGSLYVSDFFGDQILRISAIPEPSTLFLACTLSLVFGASFRKRTNK